MKSLKNKFNYIKIYRRYCADNLTIKYNKLKNN